jgi:hypothetical protein
MREWCNSSHRNMNSVILVRYSCNANAAHLLTIQLVPCIAYLVEGVYAEVSYCETYVDTSLSCHTQAFANTLSPTHHLCSNRDHTVANSRKRSNQDTCLIRSVSHGKTSISAATFVSHQNHSLHKTRVIVSVACAAAAYATSLLRFVFDTDTYASYLSFTLHFRS